MPKLTKRIVDAAEPGERPYFLWCSELPGFGVRVFPSGKRVYYADYRPQAGSRKRFSLGPHGKLTAEDARKLALQALGSVLKGEDPAEERATRRKAITVRELCERYLAATDKGLILGKRGGPKRPSTVLNDRSRIDRHVIPLLGTKKVADLTNSDMARFMRDIASGKTASVTKSTKLRGKSIVEGGRGVAARTMGLMGGILSFAISEGIISLNPVHGVKRPADNRRQRRLTWEEYAQLGKALVQAEEKRWAEQGVLGVRLLALTGCRLGEIVGLRWQEVDSAGGCFRLTETKEGASVRPIGRPAFDLLESVSARPGCPYVLPAARGNGRFGGMPGFWNRIIGLAELEGVTPHTLRHSFASVAGDLGYSESTIGAMLGHAAGTVTSRYVHHLDSVLVAAADRVAERIAEALAGKGGGAGATT